MWHLWFFLSQTSNFIYDTYLTKIQGYNGEEEKFEHTDESTDKRGVGVSITLWPRGVNNVLRIPYIFDGNSV